MLLAELLLQMNIKQYKVAPHPRRHKIFFSIMKRSRILKLNRDFELYIMEENETFDNFYTCFSNIVNCSYIWRDLSERK